MRAGAVPARLRIAPEGLAARLEGLFATAVADPAAAADELERLVAEMVALVEAHRPDADTAAVRAQLGRRERPWLPVPHVLEARPPSAGGR